MAKLFRVTYSTVTPESAEIGDIAESGFATPYSGKDASEAVSDEDLASGAYNWTLAQVVRRFGRGCYDSGSWFSEIGRDEDYRTGADTTYDLHPPEGITDASYRRVARVLGARR